MEILDGIEIRDLALYFPEENILVISDTHMGYEEAMNKQGVLIPRFQFKSMIDRLRAIIGDGCFDKIIINGDIKHEFGAISEQEWRHTLRLLDFLKKHSKEIILIKGNHDKIIGPIADKRNVRVLNSFKVGGVLVVHGHKLPEKKELRRVNTIIIGHEHPAISVHDKIKEETYKCYLLGKWGKYDLIVQPSFTLVSEGTDVTKQELLSPFLKQDLGNFKVYIVGDRVYEFGKIKKIN